MPNLIARLADIGDDPALSFNQRAEIRSLGRDLPLIWPTSYPSPPLVVELACRETMR